MIQPIATITDFPTTMINDWIFDLDNTIYPARTNLFLRVAARITEFVANHYSVPHDEARVIQKDLFHRYGTTMRGMMTEEAICPDTYLNFVHDIDLSKLKKNSVLFKKIKNLPGSKIIYTNGEKNYAEKVLKSLGVSNLFKSIWDIKKSKFIPKPEISPLKNLLSTNKIDNSSCVYFEDIEKNLRPAHQLGITTVHITDKNPTIKKSYVDFRFKTIISALDMINKNF